MMKYLIAILVMVLIALAASSQEYSRWRGCETILGKAEEAGVSEIKYYKNDYNGQGPVYVIAKGDVSEIPKAILCYPYALATGLGHLGFMDYSDAIIKVIA